MRHSSSQSKQTNTEHDMDFRISFGKGENFWTNVFPTELVTQFKGDIAKCCKDGASTIGDVKTKTKAGTGCGGCMPLITNIFKAEMKKAGLAVSADLCSHFRMSRQDLFQVIKCAALSSYFDTAA